MGTKVQSKSYLPGYHSMRDLNEDANSFNWPLFYGDKTIPTGQCYNGFLPRVADTYPGYDKDTVKHTMLEHEAVFKNQVYELHRVYRIQRDLMEEIKKKELHQSRIPFKTSSLSASVSGAEDVHSPFSHLKGNSAQGGIFPSQNGSSSKSKDTEVVVEHKPSKVRRKMFDLHLPADEYIETEDGEQFGNANVEPDDSRPGFSLRSRATGLADLNEPAQVEETNPPEYVDLVSTSCHREVRGNELPAKANSQFLVPTKEISLNSDVENIRNLYLENGNGRMWHPRVPKTGQSKNSLNSTSQGKPSQALLNKAREPPNFQTDSKTDRCREITNNGLGTSGRNPDAATYNHPDTIVSWSQSVSSWEKSNSSLNPRSMPVQSQPSLNLSSTLSKSSHSPSQIHSGFGNMWYRTSKSSFRKEFPNQNGFCNGSSSGSKALQLKVPDLFASRGSTKDVNGSNSVGSVKGVDLNVALASSLSIGAVFQQGVGFSDGERNRKSHFTGLPWLKSENANKADATNSVKDFNNLQLSFFCSATDQLSSKSDSVKIVDGSNNAKILGFPIFEKPYASEKENGFETVVTRKKSKLLDMNSPCDAAYPDFSKQTVEKRTGEKDSVVRRLIDLNSCITDDEAPLTHIDLEVSAVSETDEERLEETQQDDDFVKQAANAIVDISSFVHKSKIDIACPSSPDALNWFAEIACGNDTEIGFHGENSISEVDYFESMTLQLTETKSEDYIPTPPVIDNFQAEETVGSVLTTRPRRGQARRGRQRRDFQRDILPGLTTLSRHEVTEDIQTFGSMMRATGHSWQSGLARRNSGRGRRRAVASPPVVAVAAVSLQRVSSIEIGVEEMSLTGWGKTTRRPRRQRCHAAGIHQSLALR